MTVKLLNSSNALFSALSVKKASQAACGSPKTTIRLA